MNLGKSIGKLMMMAATAGCFMPSSDFLDTPTRKVKKKCNGQINNNTKFVGASKAKRASRKMERQNRKKGRK